MSAPRLLVEIEGHTEEEFVKNVLRPHLLTHGHERVDARLLGNARQRDRRGGITNWPSARKDILRHLHGDRALIVTTMVDYYALPASGSGAWPGREQAERLVTSTSSERADAVETAVLEDIVRSMGRSFDPRRFVPFVTMHEYEGLLFSNCDTLAAVLGDPSLAAPLAEIRSRFATPEDINDSSQTAPSKRLEALVPRYEKIVGGVMALLDIGLPKVRAECPHFDQWVRRLEDRVTGEP